MSVAARGTCRIEYRGSEIVIRGEPGESRREADRIIRRFACSATPYRIADETAERLVLKPE